MTDSTITPGHPFGDGPVIPRWLETTRGILSVIGRIELLLAILALVAVVILSGAQAILRYTIGASLWWAQEVAQLTIVVAYFFGVSYVFKSRQYILIEFLSAKLSLRGQLVLYIFAQVLTIVFAATVVILVIRFAPMLLQMTTPSLALPDLVRSIPLAIASVMMVLTSLYYLAFGVWALATRLPGNDLHEIERLVMVSPPSEEIEL